MYELAKVRRPSQNRDDRSGQYAMQGNYDRMCVCGHTLGVHAHAAPHDCFHGTGAESPRDPGNLCGCWKFRQSKKK